MNRHNKSPCHEVTICLYTPIGPLNITGCKLGMHSVYRVDKHFTMQPDLSVKCKILSHSNIENDLLTTEIVQECIDWFDQYFSIGKNNSNATLNPICIGKHPSICTNIGLC